MNGIDEGRFIRINAILLQAIVREWIELFAKIQLETNENSQLFEGQKKST